MNDKVSISKISGIDFNFLQMITLENVGIQKWGIRNRFNKTTPFFENVPYIVPIDDKSLLMIGESKGQRNIYYVHNVDDEDEIFYTKANTIGDLVYLNDIDRDVAILTTDKGEYLFDKNTLTPKSDLFDNIAYLDNRLVFSKTISHNGRDFPYYGDVDLDGNIGKYIYDSYNDVFLSVPLMQDPDYGFDAIDEIGLEEELGKLVEDKNKIQKDKIKMLHRLNIARK